MWDAVPCLPVLTGTSSTIHGRRSAPWMGPPQLLEAGPCLRMGVSLIEMRPTGVWAPGGGLLGRVLGHRNCLRPLAAAFQPRAG